MAHPLVLACGPGRVLAVGLVLNGHGDSIRIEPSGHSGEVGSARLSFVYVHSVVIASEYRQISVAL
jgi:hypothetical protein